MVIKKSIVLMCIIALVCVYHNNLINLDNRDYSIKLYKQFNLGGKKWYLD